MTNTFEQISPTVGRTPLGYDVGVCDFQLTGSSGKRVVKALALLGRHGLPAPLALAEAAIASLASRQSGRDESVGVAALLLSCALLERGLPRPRWPVVVAGRQLDRRRNTFRSLITAFSRTDGRAAAGKKAAELFERYQRAREPIAEAVRLARWNVPPLEYGPATDDEVFGLARQFFAECFAEGTIGSYEPEGLREWVIGQIEDAFRLQDADAIPRLATLRGLIAFGTDLIESGLPAVYGRARAELAELHAGHHLPRHVCTALEAGARINDLLYSPNPRFGGEVVLWQPVTPTRPEAVLVLPTVLGSAAAKMGAKWWPQFLSAVAGEEDGSLERFERDIRAYAFLIANRRGTAGVSRRDRSRVRLDQATNLDLDRLPTPPADAERASDLIARIQETLGDHRAVRAALLSIYDGLNSSEIGARLGVGKSRANELVNEGKARLRQHPAIRELLEPD